MRLLVINPNTNAGMTATILAAARAAVGPEVRVEAISPTRGPVSVEGRLDEIVSGYWALDAVLPLAEGYDGFAVACYGHHPLVGALREALRQPVLGIMEASVLHALPLGERFSIVTTSPRWCPLIEEGLRALGLAARCASVRSSDLSVLDLVDLPDDVVRTRLVDEARAAVEHDGAEVILLGCAGMAGLEQAVSAATRVPVVDGVRAAVTMLRGLVESGAQTSKRSTYRPLEPRLAIGLPPSIASIYAQPGRPVPEAAHHNGAASSPSGITAPASSPDDDGSSWRPTR
ncbi:MAG: aspartate/glutamate racemase family protein [Chloroflexi bacterium]|nr:aspartate/glutamate racemase family protein [Chloroflexota bacterium]